MVIVGEGPLRRPLEDEARALGIGGRVSMPGFTTEIGPTLEAARCVAITSRRKSTGLVCVEALGYALPVVATDCGASKDARLRRALAMDDGLQARNRRPTAEAEA